MNIIIKLLITGGVLFFSSLSWAVEYEARLQWSKRVELGPLVSGVVTEIPVARGDYVKGGQLLLELDPREYQAILNSASARMTKLRDIRSEALRELERSRELFERALLSVHDFDLAKLAYSEAHENFQEAGSAKTIAALNLEHSRIVAPFDAVILEINAVPGQSIVTRYQSVPLITVAASGSMLAQFEITEKDLGLLKRGQLVEVNVVSRKYNGTIAHIGLEPEEPGDVRYRVEVVFSNGEKEQLRAGQSARIITQ